MKLSILTMVTKPDERQDLWREALQNYCALADEVICVNGGPTLTYPDSKVKFVDLFWPEEWDWEELPKHLNAGLAACTGDWVLKLDIDQLIAEKDFNKLRSLLPKIPETVDLLSLVKLNYVANMKYYSKNTQPILFRRKPDIGFGVINGLPKGDLCMPMRIVEIGANGVPIGEEIPSENTDCFYWNFSYTFKTEEVAKAHYLRMCRAYRKYYKDNVLGANDEESWQQFMHMVLEKYKKAIHEVTYYELPESMRRPINQIKPEQKGYNIWGNIAKLK